MKENREESPHRDHGLRPEEALGPQFETICRIRPLQEEEEAVDDIVIKRGETPSVTLLFHERNTKREFPFMRIFGEEEKQEPICK